jgi:hypothetical protein
VGVMRWPRDFNGCVIESSLGYVCCVCVNGSVKKKVRSIDHYMQNSEKLSTE